MKYTFLVSGITNVFTAETAADESETSSAKSLTADTDTTTSKTTTTVASADEETAKEKRQIEGKDTPVYPNHRSDSNVNPEDDPENPQETIYGSKPNQFVIRPVAPHQHQQHEEHQQPQLRSNYPVGLRQPSSQLVEQSQEVSVSEDFVKNW